MNFASESSGAVVRRHEGASGCGVENVYIRHDSMMCLLQFIVEVNKYSLKNIIKTFIFTCTPSLCPFHSQSILTMSLIL